jgi:hypothetical protein
LRLRRAATAFKPARAGIKRNSEGLATDMGRTAAKLHYRPIGDHVNAFFELFGAIFPQIVMSLLFFRVFILPL